MKDKLEHFIDENRSAFDDQDPSPGVWRQISRKLNSNTSNRNLWMWRVASFIFFTTTLVLFADRILEQEPVDNALSEEVQQTDFDGVESFYMDRIEEKRNLIYSSTVDNTYDFEHDLDKLDAMYQVLKEEWQQDPSQQVMDALILNLLIRIDVLNEELERIEGEKSGDVTI